MSRSGELISACNSVGRIPEVEEAMIALLFALCSISLYTACFTESLSGTASIIMSADFEASATEFLKTKLPLFGKSSVNNFL